MHTSKATSYAITASVAIAMLAGCSGASSQMGPTPLGQTPGGGNQTVQQQPFQARGLNSFLAMNRSVVPGHGVRGSSFMDPRAVRKPLLFVSYGGTIDIYLQGGKNKMVGQIGESGTSSAYYLATDTAGDLYSANQDLSAGTVTIYAPPYTSGPKLTLPVTTFSLAVSRQGTVAVLPCTASFCGNAVVFYAAGSTTPCATVPLDASAFPNGGYGIAFDHKGNLYVGNGGSGTEAPVTVGKIGGGCEAKKVRTFTTANSILYSGDLKVDKAGRIAIFAVVGKSPYAYAIDTYDPPKRSLGNPVSTTSLPAPPHAISGTFAFQASGRNFWTIYYGVGPSYGPATYEFAYPAGGVPKKTVIGSYDSVYPGVAVTPPLVP